MTEPDPVQGIAAASWPQQPGLALAQAIELLGPLEAVNGTHIRPATPLPAVKPAQSRGRGGSALSSAVLGYGLVI